MFWNKWNFTISKYFKANKSKRICRQYIGRKINNTRWNNKY